MSGCTGASCYCADSSCEAAGPCRSVIDGAPGAREPDAENPSRGPAPEAASAVGACLQGLVGGGGLPGGLPGIPPTPVGADAGPSNPAGPGDAG
jgi:hypothetical protein